MSDRETKSPPLDLATQPDFRLGGLLVSPSTCRVSAAGAEEKVEPRVMEVLTTLSMAVGQTVPKDRLVEVCWGGRAVSDDAISRAIAKVRQLARHGGGPHFNLETFPKVGFRLQVANGREETPVPSSSVQQDPLHDAPPAAPPDEARGSGYLDYVPGGRAFHAAGLMGLLLVLFAMLGWRQGWVGAAGNVDEASISPFVALRENEDLKIIAHRASTATARYVSASGIPTILDAFPRTEGRSQPDTEFQVSGTVDATEDKIFFTPQINDLQSGTVLWTTRFMRPKSEAAGMEEEVAHVIAGVLRCSLYERRNADSDMTSDVLSLFMYACHSGFVEFRDVFVLRRLAQKVPSNAGALAMLALGLSITSRESDNVPEQSRQLADESLELARRALEINDSAVNAHIAKAIVLRAPAQWRDREMNLQRAMEINPDSVMSVTTYVQFLRETGRVGAALDLASRLEKAADMRAILNAPNIAFMLAHSGDLAGALAAVRRLGEIRPETAKSLPQLLQVWWGTPADALRMINGVKAVGDASGSSECYRQYLTKLETARGKAIRGLPEACASLSVDYRIRLLSRQGDVDGAYELLGKPLPNSRSWMFLFYPEMKPVRQDRRFMPLAERLGLLSYWRQTSQWPDFCRDPDLAYTCR